MSKIQTNENFLISLDRLKVGEAGSIDSYTSDSELNYRLRELGLTKGTKISVKRLAPFGDPMELRIRGYSLSIRKQDAAQILIKKD